MVKIYTKKDLYGKTWKQLYVIYSSVVRGTLSKDERAEVSRWDKEDLKDGIIGAQIGERVIRNPFDMFGL